MWNIMRSQIYQICRDVFIICVILVLGGIYTIFVIDGMSGVGDLNGGMAFITEGEWFAAMICYMMVLIPARICGGDFNDRTLNYEVLAGHTKAQIYFGRVFVSCGFMLLIAGLMLGIPVIVGCINGGWGPNLAVGAALLRCGLILLVLIRFCAEMSCLSFLLRNGFAAMVAGWIGLAVVAAVALLFSENGKLHFLSFLACIMDLATVENSRMGFADGHDITLYLAELEPSFAASVLISTFVIIAVCIPLGYLGFQKRDLK